jgi:hypothetical protein
LLDVAGTRESVFFVDGTGHHHGRHAGRTLLGQPRQGGQHAGHAAFDVARPAAVDPALAHFGLPRLDRHAFDRHGVLMGLEHQDRTTVRRRHFAVQSGQDVVAAGSHRLPYPRQAEPIEQLLEVIRDAMFEVDVALDLPAHGIDTRNSHQVTQCVQQIQGHRRNPFCRV